MQLLDGWAVKITRKDGTWFMACGEGNITPVWCKGNRKWAVRYKKVLRVDGFKASVVAVKYMDPVVISDPG